MQRALGTITGKTIRAGLKLRRNGGHALPEGVIIITGTNGKTTTTKIVSHLLKANGKRVLTNPTGSNLSRGIASSLAHHSTVTGKLKYDIAVLEVDEASAKALVKQVEPRWVLGLNVSRDQLDRFGEVDTVAIYVGTAMDAATEGVVTNAADPHLFKLAKDIKVPFYFFGVANDLQKYFPNDYELAAVEAKKVEIEKQPLAVELADFKDQTVTYKFGSQRLSANLLLSGQHNFLNGAAALALCQQLLPNVQPKDLVDELAKVDLAFGRGEKYRLKNGAEIELVLVKNPASFTQALASYTSKETSLMIAINDNIADGRDVSWLWDVNFSPLAGDVFMTSGKRAADMALRLSYDGTTTSQIEPDLPKALKILAQQSNRKVILATYTAMLQLYGVLTKQGEKI
jgi:UDP-N-acetylmuramyl tripeptide synthase